MIRNATLLAAIAFCSIGCNGQSGETAGAQPKIIDGVQIAAEDAPQILAIDIDGIDRQTGQRVGALCTGTAISSNKVLTAAHCFMDMQLLGVTISNERESFPAVRLWMHSSFTGQTLQGSEADLAILESSRTLPAGIGIYQSLALSPYEPVFVYGYGETNDGTYGELYAGWMYLERETKSSLFATYHEGDTSEPCVGDSGGPLIGATFDVHGNTTSVGLIGVTSYGSTERCVNGDQTRFVNLRWSSAVQFIKAVVPEAVFY